MPTSPTARTLAFLRESGATCQKVEYWNPFGRNRVDLFGCIDIVAIDQRQIIGIQATSADNLSHRWVKACAEPRLRNWLEAGGRFEIWVWSKRGPRGAPKTWQLSVRKMTLEDCAVEDLSR